SPSDLTRTMFQKAARLALRVGETLGSDTNIEGSWYGNDTVWRMSLDLQTILHYGNGSGELEQAPTRRVLTITDAIVAGEGEGPLSPTPVPLGIVTMGENVAALEWVHALLMGFEPTKIPLIREAFSSGPRPLARFSPEEIEVRFAGMPYRADQV